MSRRAASFECPQRRYDAPAGLSAERREVSRKHSMRLLTAALASARSIATTDKPSTRRPRGGAAARSRNLEPAARGQAGDTRELCYSLAMKDRAARE